jgi:chromosome segregation ATPase
MYQETQVELKGLLSKVNAAKSKGVNTPQYRFALNQYYNKQLEGLGFLDKLNKLQGKNVDLKSQVDQVKKKMEFLKKAQGQAAQTTSKNVQNQTNKNIENMKSQQQANVSNAQGEMKKKMDDYRMALRKWHEGGQKGPQPNPPGPVNLPNVQAPAANVPANFLKPMTLKEEIRRIVRETLGEMNPDSSKNAEEEYVMVTIWLADGGEFDTKVRRDELDKKLEEFEKDPKVQNYGIDYYKGYYDDDY